MSKSDEIYNSVDFTAYCGLYCGDCIRFGCKASDLSSELLDEIDSNRFTEYANVKQRDNKVFGSFDTLILLLKTISEIKCKTPCRLGGDGCNESCEIKMCVNDKSMEGCWECDEFSECVKLDFLKPIHGDGPLNNLKIIKKYGILNWVNHRDKCYPWM